MKMTKFTKILSLLLCLALVVAIAVFAGCSKQNDKAPETTAPVAADVSEDATKLGQGEKVFTFIAKDADGKETKFEISSDAATVGAALLENNLIAGDESEYGLYVKTVNGITLDYDADHMYWAFYVGDAYAEKGVDATELVAGTTYSFVATAG